MANETTGRPSKNERRNLAREQARLAREQEKKREKRNRLFLQGGIAVGVLAVLAVIALILTQTLKPAGPGPENMASGGAIFTKDLQVVPTAALEPGQDRVAPEVDRESLPLDVTVYVDYMCPACGAFEQQYGSMLENYVGSGDVNLQVYPLNFLDGQSLGSKYSTRAGNLFACVVEDQPDKAFDLHNRLLSQEVQPREQTSGLSNDELLEQAKDSGVDVTDEIKQCVKDVRFGSFIATNYKTVSEVGIQGLAKGAQVVNNPQTGELQAAGGPQLLRSTPTVIVNGQQWVSNRDGDLEAYLLKVKGEIEQNSSKDTKSETETKSE